jgi:S-adenosylmethionine:tRNA ribosyltransferase-isomerase
MENPGEISISQYDYPLPDEFIAKHPLHERDASRLLIYRNAEIRESVFRRIGDFIPSDTVLVFNNSKVVHARLLFTTSTGAQIECFCLEPATGLSVEQGFNSIGHVEWICMVGNLKRWKGEPLVLCGDGLELKAELAGRDGMDCMVRFSWNQNTVSFAEVLERCGKVPLPPYIKREAEPEDDKRYNTVYADPKGSVAAPTAGLHFTSALLDELKKSGHREVFLTLHVGAGTFLPVKAEKMEDHIMHSEKIAVSRESLLEVLDGVRRNSVAAVGTTSLRTLESLYWFGCRLLLDEELPDEMFVEQWYPYRHKEENLPSSDLALEAVLRYIDSKKESVVTGATQLIIAPGYRFRIAEMLITNFHQPCSTLLLLVSAFVNGDWRSIYNYALEKKFRFLSFGDSSLLFLEKPKTI